MRPPCRLRHSLTEKPSTSGDGVVTQVRSNPQNCIGSAHHLRPVGDTYARYVEAPETVIYLPLLLDVKVCRALVEKENLRLSVERPRKQHSLLLAARQ